MGESFEDLVKKLIKANKKRELDYSNADETVEIDEKFESSLAYAEMMWICALCKKRDTCPLYKKMKEFARKYKVVITVVDCANFEDTKEDL